MTTLASAISTAIATEIGVMRVNSELLALASLGIDPPRFIVWPRVISTTVSVPLLTIYFSTMAVLGGFLALFFIDSHAVAEWRSGAVLGLSVIDLPLVLVSHQPARDTVTDLAGNGAHVGSTAVRTFIERHKPVLCLSGHIHEAQGTDAIGSTILVNPGPFMEGRYVVAEITGNTCRVDIRRASAS